MARRCVLDRKPAFPPDAARSAPRRLQPPFDIKRQVLGMDSYAVDLGCKHQRVHHLSETTVYHDVRIYAQLPGGRVHRDRGSCRVRQRRRSSRKSD